MTTTVEHPLFEDVFVPEGIMEDIQEFANSMGYSHYAEKRKQENPKKLFEDNVMAKAAEWVVYDRLSVIPDLSEPDMEIYEPGEKSWDPDLFSKSEGLSFLIKSCNARRETSWIIQKSNADGIGGKDKEFYFNPSLKKIAVFVEMFMERDECRGRIRTTASTTYLDKYREDLFQPPRKETLIGIKDAIYWGHMSLRRKLDGEDPKYVAEAIKHYWQ